MSKPHPLTLTLSELIASFHERYVVVDRGYLTPCWEWKTRVGRAGYGGVMMDGKTYVASRVSWTIFRGAIPEGLWVLHHCDNPPCVNPDHLFPGTRTDNIADMERKGRAKHPRGEAHGMAVLTEGDIRKLRELQRAGNSLRAIASVLGVSISCCHAVCSGKTWRHVD